MKKPSTVEPLPEETALENAISTAAARVTAAEFEEASLVNAVARAAARSLSS